MRLVFQPAEEGGQGAQMMVDEGLLEKTPKPLVAMGLHVSPDHRTGVVASREGPLMAATARCVISVSLSLCLSVCLSVSLSYLTLSLICTSSLLLGFRVSLYLYPSCYVSLCLSFSVSHSLSLSLLSLSV